jgi:hypothetical protein
VPLLSAPHPGLEWLQCFLPSMRPVSSAFNLIVLQWLAWQLQQHCLPACLSAWPFIARSGQSQVLHFGPRWLSGISRKARIAMGLLTGRLGPLPLPFQVPIYLVQCGGGLEWLTKLAASAVWCEWVA